MRIGHNVNLSRQEIEQAIKERALRVAKGNGAIVDIDPLDFQNRAEVHYQFSAERGSVGPELDSVSITWAD